MFPSPDRQLPPTVPLSWGDQVKRQIRRRYMRVAEVGLGGREAMASALAAGYSQDFLESVPRQVVNAYCGCGNPLAGADLSNVRVAVDLGCGAGLDARNLAGKLEPDATVIALDMTTAMLALSYEPPIQPVAGDMENLPLADGIADLVLANASFNLTLNKPAAFAEAFRVLRPGGRLLARDLISHGELPQEMLEDPLAWNTSLGGVLEESDLREVMMAAGFDEINISDHRAFPPVTSVRLEATKPDVGV